MVLGIISHRKRHQIGTKSSTDVFERVGQLSIKQTLWDYKEISTASLIDLTSSDTVKGISLISPSDLS